MLHPGQLLHNDRYKIEEQVGKGGQGSVYRAVDLRLGGRVVAIKEAEVRSSTLYEAFRHEGLKLAKFRHSGLPTALDAFEEGHHQYLVREYIEGLDFAQRLRERKQQHQPPFAVSEVLKWADSLLDVVIYLHSRKTPLIHRDIKPHNLKLDEDGRIILLDFGIAKGGLTRLTTFQRPNGYTPGYAPPEQEQAGQTDERTDIYAIGATLYYLLTLQRPPSATMRRNGEPLRRANELNPHVPHELADILAQAMALDSAQRFASAQEMRMRLARVDPLESFPPQSRWHSEPLHPQKLPPPPPQPVNTYPDKRLTQPPWWADLWRQLIAVAIAILLAVLFVGMLLTAIGGRTGEADVTMTPDEGMANASTPVAPSPTEENVAEDEPVADVPTPVAPSPTEESASDAEPIPRSTPFPTIIIADNSTKTPTIAHQPNDRKPISNTNVQEIVQLARFGKGQIEEIAYSPDGKLLAVATSLGVYIYDAETLEKVRLIEHDHFLFSAAFSPDGQFIAAGGSSDDAIIHIWNVSDGTKVMELVGHENKINNVLFSADEQTLASASDDGTVRLWNLADGTIRQILNGHDGGVTSLAFNATGDTLVSGSYDYTARVWQVENGTLLATLDGHSDWVRGVAVHPNGQLIATSSQDGTVNVWQDESVLYTLSDFSGRVESVAFSPDGKILATGSYFDKEISLWQAQDGELIETLEQAGVYDLIFSADGNTLATIFWGHSLELWRKPADQLQGFTSFNDLRDHTNGMTSVALTPDGQFVASGSYDQRVRVWDWQENQLLGKFSGHSGFIAEVAFSDFVREGAQVPYFVSGSQDQTVVVWNNGDVIDTLEGHEGVVNSVAFQKSGITVASGSSDNTVRLWRSDGLLHTFTEHTDEITSVIFNQSGEHVISGSEDKTVRIWKVEEGTLVNTLDGFDFAVTSVAEVNNEQFIAAGLDDGTIVLWRDGTRLGTLEGHQGRIDDMSFTADGTLLASGSYADRSIMLWDLEDGSLLHTLIGHNERVTGVMFNEDHTVLASSSDDGTIRLWGIEP